MRTSRTTTSAKVAVVGAGMAAATEWLNALAAGSEVVSIRRREPLRRPLNVPRAYFSKRGLAGFHRLAPAERIAVLARPGAAVVSAGPRVGRAARTGHGRVTVPCVRHESDASRATR